MKRYVKLYNYPDGLHYTVSEESTPLDPEKLVANFEVEADNDHDAIAQVLHNYAHDCGGEAGRGRKRRNLFEAGIVIYLGPESV
jgi:hypothetical protein